MSNDKPPIQYTYSLRDPVAADKIDERSNSMEEVNKNEVEMKDIKVGMPDNNAGEFAYSIKDPFQYSLNDPAANNEMQLPQ